MSKASDVQQAAVPKTADDLYRLRRGRNIALAGVLVFLVALFFVMTIVKMRGAEEKNHPATTQSPKTPQ